MSSRPETPQDGRQTPSEHSSLAHIEEAMDPDRSLVVAPEDHQGFGPKAALVIAQLRHELSVRDEELSLAKRQLARKDFDLALRRTGSGTGRGSNNGSATPPSLPSSSTPQRVLSRQGTPLRAGSSAGSPYAPFALAARGARSAPPKTLGRDRLVDLGTPGSPGSSPFVGGPASALDFLSDSEDDFDEAATTRYNIGLLGLEDHAETAKLKSELDTAKAENESLRQRLEQKSKIHEDEVAALLARIHDLDIQTKIAPSCDGAHETEELQKKIDEQSKHIEKWTRVIGELTAKLASKGATGASQATTTTPQKGRVLQQIQSPLSQSQGELSAAKNALQEDWQRLSHTLYNLVGRLAEANGDEESNNSASKLDEPPALFSPTYLHRCTKILLAQLDTKYDHLESLKQQEKSLKGKAKYLGKTLRRGLQKLQELDKAVEEKTARLMRRRQMEIEMFEDSEKADEEAKATESRETSKTNTLVSDSRWVGTRQYRLPLRSSLLIFLSSFFPVS